METRCADETVEITLPTSVVDIVCAEDDAAPDCRSVGSSGSRRHRRKQNDLRGPVTFIQYDLLVRLLGFLQYCTYCTIKKEVRTYTHSESVEKLSINYMYRPSRP